MCGRSRCTLAPDQVAAAAGIPPEQLQQRWVNQERYAPSYNVSPGYWTPVVRMGDDGGRMVEAMKWGLVPSFAKRDERPDHYRMFNARSETVASKGVFSRLLPKRRCVVLLEGFYEWKATGAGKKQPYYVHLKEEGHQGVDGKQQREQEEVSGNGWDVMRMAGLYDTWTDANGQQMTTYTILTTDSSSRLSWLHDRMPALLVGEEAVNTWLTGEKGIMEVICPYNGNDLSWHPVTPAMSKPSYQSPDACQDTKTAKGSIAAFFSPQKPSPSKPATAAAAAASKAGRPSGHGSSSGSGHGGAIGGSNGGGGTGGGAAFGGKGGGAAAAGGGTVASPFGKASQVGGKEGGGSGGAAARRGSGGRSGAPAGKGSGSGAGGGGGGGAGPSKGSIAYFFQAGKKDGNEGGGGAAGGKAVLKQEQQQECSSGEQEQRVQGEMVVKEEGVAGDGGRGHQVHRQVKQEPEVKEEGGGHGTGMQLGDAGGEGLRGGAVVLNSNENAGPSGEEEREAAAEATTGGLAGGGEQDKGQIAGARADGTAAAAAAAGGAGSKRRQGQALVEGADGGGQVATSPKKARH